MQTERENTKHVGDQMKTPGQAGSEMEDTWETGLSNDE